MICLLDGCYRTSNNSGEDEFNKSEHIDEDVLYVLFHIFSFGFCLLLSGLFTPLPLRGGVLAQASVSSSRAGGEALGGEAVGGEASIMVIDADYRS